MTGTFSEVLINWLSGLFRAVVVVWLLTLLVFYSLELKETRGHRATVDSLESLSFDDFMVYHAIDPAKPVVAYGSDARFISDSEVLQGGFRIDWRERIECDYNPHDSIINFEHYATAELSEATYDAPKARIPSSVPRMGFPVRSVSTSRIIEYPSTDADCRLVSRMTQHHPHGHRKVLLKVSSVVKVRAL